MYDTILVPTDGSEHARRAAEHAATLADAFDAAVHAISVVDVQAAAGPFSAGGVDDEYLARFDSDAEDALATVEEVADERGVGTVSSSVLRGRPTKTILEYARDHEVDLVAMGTHGRTGIDRYVAGSVTENVVRMAEMPVLTTRATERSRLADGYEEVLLPTDGSEFAAVAYAHGIAIARQFGARVHAVTVVNVTDVTGSGALSAELEEQLRSEGEAMTGEIAAQARDAGLEVITSVRDGHPESELLDYADERNVDLIAMGTAGRTGPSRYLLGSTTERTIRHAEVPVLAVDARERAE